MESEDGGDTTDESVDGVSPETGWSEDKSIDGVEVSAVSVVLGSETGKVSVGVASVTDESGWEDSGGVPFSPETCSLGESLVEAEEIPPPSVGAVVAAVDVESGEVSSVLGFGLTGFFLGFNLTATSGTAVSSSSPGIKR